MPAPPRVAIVMTAYNVADYIGAAIESALAQTFSDFELLVVDDGSTDDTPQIAGAIADARLRVVRSPHRGAAAQLREGIALTQAHYLALLDGDDLWSPTKLERHVQFLDAHPEADLTFSWSRIIDEHGRDTGLASRHWNGPISFDELLADNVIGNGSALVLRRYALTAAGGIDPAFSAYYDLDAWLRMAARRPGSLWAIPEFLTFYRRRAGQLTSDVPALEQDFDRLIRKAHDLAPRVVAQVEKQARSNMRRFFAYGWYQAGDYAKSVRTLAGSLACAPKTFLADRRNYQMGAAALSGLLLPARLHGYITRAALRVARA